MSLVGLLTGVAGGLLGGGPSTRNVERAQNAFYDDRNRALQVYNDPRFSAHGIQAELTRLVNERLTKDTMTALRNFAATDPTREYSDTTRDRVEGKVAFDASREAFAPLVNWVMNKGNYQMGMSNSANIDPNVLNAAGAIDSARSGSDPLKSVMTIASAFSEGGTPDDTADNIVQEAQANTNVKPKDSRQIAGEELLARQGPGRGGPMSSRYGGNPAYRR